jgi:hypothetical protein
MNTLIMCVSTDKSHILSGPLLLKQVGLFVDKELRVTIQSFKPVANSEKQVLISQ